MAPEAFDLSRFSPPTGVTVAFRNGGSYRFPGDPDVDDVAVMLRLEGDINDKAGPGLADALQEGKETLRRLILSADPSQDVSGLKVGPEEMLVVFALLVHGSTVAEAVGAAITAHNLEGGESHEPGDADDERAAEVGAEGPLSRSESSSSERSSGSDADEASLQATG